MYENCYEKLIVDATIERNNNCSYRNLIENSEEYKRLDNENMFISKQYPWITTMLEQSELKSETYSKIELSALMRYMHNHYEMENMERLQIYKLGIRDCLNLIYSTEK